MHSFLTKKNKRGGVKQSNLIVKKECVRRMLKKIISIKLVEDSFKLYKKKYELYFKFKT